ncbi:hypothetical protein [Streptomyces antimicrobicus]|uniref:Gram-positive cocci surface proteins LPxTG domain-containing protein n=1 Tax=Streptomyces antimicrobicus TaxID=2883108 RepID=A0ABS8B300_9ACTN|nr:hypothetical protein [Streptomyces antimicrobicus]MCB5178985.1 hypothetical protein [Streptomyces antimicrobicus]
MKLKRMAAVAAAAVVGPTVLMTTPAMADEQQPAVTVPDAAPKDDAPAAAGTAKPAGPATPKTEQAPQTPQAPQAPQTGRAEPATGGPDDEYEQPTAVIMGPEVTLQGIPKAGFKADGSWTQLKVTVDNRGHVTVPNYTPHLSVMQWDGEFTAAQVKVERLTGGAWQPVKALTGEAMGPGLQFNLGTTASVAANSLYTVDVRISFAAGTPAVGFEMYTDGSSRKGGVVSSSPATWYEARIEGASDEGEPGPEVTEGPALAVNGVPGTVEAGGGWTHLTVRVDNTGKKALPEFGLGLVLSRPDFVPMKPGQIKAEVYSKDRNGKAGWHAADVYVDGEDPYAAIELAAGPVAAGQSFDVKVRIRFTADARPGELTLRAYGGGGLDEEELAYVESRSQAYLTKIVAASPKPDNGGGNGNSGGGGNGDTGNQPEPHGGATPIGTGTGTGSGTGTGTGTGGELAATGADPATSWAVGGAGVALAMGAALVAGTGRHRRRSTTA